MTLNPMAQLQAAVHAHGKDKNAQLNAAARQFESVLLNQLLSVMWKTSPEMQHGQGAMYQQMFQGSFAEHLAEGGGIGLASMIAKGLGATPENGGAGITHHLQAALGPRIMKLAPDAAQSGEPAVGMLADVSAAASSMLQGGGEQWSKEGTLSAQDLGAVNVSDAAGSRARETVMNAHGYQGYYKCNLFAFELARRAGLEVPLTPRGTGLGFPSSNRVTEDASDGKLDSGWAKVATGASPAAMQDALRAGEAVFMLVGQGHGDKHGHMAMMERPRSIEYDSDGSVRSIEFDGWEAQPDGAKHLTARTWNRSGNPGGPNDRNGLDRIEIIRLNRMDADPNSSRSPDVPSQVGPLSQPELGLSKQGQHPTQGAEDRS
jgi:Rod binding domain-containing protein